MLAKPADIRKHEIPRKPILGLLLCLVSPLFASNDQEVIQPGDWLFVKARPLDCDFGKRLLDAAEVSETGSVLLLGNLTIPVAGDTPEAAAQTLAAAVEQRDGYRPQTIEILRIDREDKERQAVFLLVLAKSINIPCQSAPEEVLPGREEGYRVASSTDPRASRATHTRPDDGS